MPRAVLAILTFSGRWPLFFFLRRCVSINHSHLSHCHQFLAPGARGVGAGYATAICSRGHGSSSCQMTQWMAGCPRKVLLLASGHPVYSGLCKLPLSSLLILILILVRIPVLILIRIHKACLLWLLNDMK